jgi:hypothetical protein
MCCGTGSERGHRGHGAPAFQDDAVLAGRCEPPLFRRVWVAGGAWHLWMAQTSSAAQEAAAGKPTFKSDVFSLGWTVVCAFGNCYNPSLLPGWQKPALRDGPAVLQDEDLPVELRRDECLRSLFRRMTSTSPADRPAMPKVCEDLERIRATWADGGAVVGVTGGDDSGGGGGDGGGGGGGGGGCGGGGGVKSAGGSAVCTAEHDHVSRGDR